MAKAENIYSAVWSFVLFRGILALLLGIILLAFPVGTLTVLVTIMGVFWLIDGIVIVVKSIQGRKYVEKWGWGILVGLLSVLAGVAVLSRPLLSTIFTTSFLVWLLGIGALIYGILELITGIRLPKSVDGKWSMILGGIFTALFAVMLLASPFVSAIVIVKTIGIFAIIGGIVLALVSFQIRKLVNQAE